MISEWTPSADAEAFLLPFVREFLSVLLVVPDNPDRGILSVCKMLLNVLKNFGWADANLCSIYINVVDLLAVMAQEKYPYHIDRGGFQKISLGMNPTEGFQLSQTTPYGDQNQDLSKRLRI